MSDTRFALPGSSAAIPCTRLHAVPGLRYRAAYTPESITAATLATGTPRSDEYRAHLEQQGVAMTEKTTKAASPAPTAPATISPEALRLERLHAAAERLNVAQYAAGVLPELGTVFQAIKKLAEADSLISRLAGVGMYLAQDWGNTLDYMREEVLEAMDAINGGAA